MAEGARLHARIARQLRERSDDVVRALLTVLDDGGGFHPRERQQVVEVLTELLERDPSVTTDEGERWGREARANLLTTLSHDVRGPLSTVSVSATLLRRAVSDPQLLRGVDRIERATAAALAKIDDVCHLTRIETGRLQLELGPVALDAALDEAVKKNREAVRTFHMDVVKGQCEPELFAHADRGFLQRTLAKLIANAVRYGAPGAEVILHAARAEERGSVVVIVEDDGQGAALEDAEEVFDRFWRTPARGTTGTGLELALAKGFIEAHGGRIWAEAEPGRGTRVSFTLPEHADDIATPTPKQGQQPGDSERLSPSVARGVSRAPTPSSPPASTWRAPSGQKRAAATSTCSRSAVDTSGSARG